MNWTVIFTKAAQKDMNRLDPYNRKLVTAAIEKTAERPLPPPDGIGKPLGNHASSNLSGYFKIKLKASGYRVVYGLIREKTTMKIIVVSIRDDDEVYKEAERRIKNLTE